MLLRIGVAIVFLLFENHDAAVSAAVTVQDWTTAKTRYPVGAGVSMTVIFLNLYDYGAAAGPPVKVFHSPPEIRVKMPAYVRVASAMDLQEVQPARRLRIGDNGTRLRIPSQRCRSYEHRGGSQEIP
jgi:hypothetical protein